MLKRLWDSKDESEEEQKFKNDLTMAIKPGLYGELTSDTTGVRFGT